MHDIDWKRKLTSRKFWAAIALFVSGVLSATGHNSQAETIAGLIMQGAAVIAYIVGEGLADSANATGLGELLLEDGKEGAGDEQD